MTNTNEDRVRALIDDWREDVEAWNGNLDPDYAEHHGRKLRDSGEALFEALHSDKQALERENERLNARNVEVSMLAHQWMVAHDNRVSGLPVVYPSPADMPEAEARALVLEARVSELQGALQGLEPYLDAIVCYASSMDEHEPNQLAFNARSALSKVSPSPVGGGNQEDMSARSLPGSDAGTPTPRSLQAPGSGGGEG